MAIAQSRQVPGLITARTGRAVEIVEVTTLGDVSQAQLIQVGGTGVFVSALREALLGGEVDLAVYSLKDLPTVSAAGIVLAAVPPRDDPRDARRRGTALSSPTFRLAPGSALNRRGGPRNCSGCVEERCGCRPP
jgi:hydroxymethylbilane synthase